MLIVQVCGPRAGVPNFIHPEYTVTCLLNKFHSLLWPCGKCIQHACVFTRNILQFSFLLKFRFCLFLFPSPPTTFVIPRIYPRNCLNWKGGIVKAVHPGTIIAVTSHASWAARLCSVCFLWCQIRGSDLLPGLNSGWPRLTILGSTGSHFCCI